MTVKSQISLSDVQENFLLPIYDKCCLLVHLLMYIPSPKCLLHCDDFMLKGYICHLLAYLLTSYIANNMDPDQGCRVGFSIIIPPANFVCGGYTVFTLSVRACMRPCVRPSVHKVLFP